MEYNDLDPAVLGKFSDYDDHFRVRHITDAETGLNAYIAVHNKNLGPGLGGCRFYDYESADDAIRDVLRLSRGMTYKNAMAGLPLGGGKSVIVGNPATDKTDALMEAMGKAVDSMGGDYVSAEDSGTNEHDMEAMARQTRFVMGQASEEGKLGGDPSPVTAYGVFCGLKSTVRKRYGGDTMKGLKAAVQGLGAVGYDLCRYLHEQGVELFVTDVRDDVLQKAQEEFKGAHIVAPDDIFTVEANIFAPCAMGAQLNEQTIAQMHFDVIGGAANNQLATNEDGARLQDKNILYAPDYVINAAGVIAVGYEFFEQTGKNPFTHDLTRENMMKHVEGIEQTLDEVFAIAEKRGITPAQAADEMAESIFNGDASAQKAGAA